MPSPLAWTAAHVAAIGDGGPAAPVIGAADVVPLVPGIDFWDLWPVRTPEGDVAGHGGYELWMGLSAPAVGDPGARHDLARIRMLEQGPDGVRDLGPVFPDGTSAGSREWAGFGVLDEAAGTLRVLYTAAGRRGEAQRTFEQRLFEATAPARRDDDGRLVLGAFGPHVEVVRADGAVYRAADEAEGAPGFIKAFRDPFLLTGPDGPRLLFTGSLAASTSDFNGTVGLARPAAGGGWELLPPPVHADGLNNELERPHVVLHGGLAYLFISTQRRTFAPGIDAPTGLYGFVAPAVEGPYRPLNGSGLVLRNPPAEPFQAYSWMVLPDLRVVSFVDAYALGGRRPEDVDAEGPEASRRHFGGTAAPVLRLALDGDRATLAG